MHDKDDEGSGGATSTSYYLKYKHEYKKKANYNSRGRKKASGLVDLDLPTGEKCTAGGGSTATRRVRNLRRVKNLVQSLKIRS